MQLKVIKRYYSVLIVLLLVLSPSTCVTGKLKTDKEWELEKEKIIEKMKDRLSKVEPELVQKINDILDKMSTKEYLRMVFGALKSVFDDKDLLERKEGIFLLEKSDITIPIIIERLVSKKGKGTEIEDRRYWQSLMVYFRVFLETKTVESLPFLIEYLETIPEAEREYATYMHPFITAVKAIMKITGLSFEYDYDELFDQRHKIANQSKKWYVNHRETHQ